MVKARGSRQVCSDSGERCWGHEADVSCETWGWRIGLSYKRSCTDGFQSVHLTPTPHCSSNICQAPTHKESNWSHTQLFRLSLRPIQDLKKKQKTKTGQEVDFESLFNPKLRKFKEKNMETDWPSSFSSVACKSKILFIFHCRLLLFYCSRVLWKPQEALPDSQCEL